jgi:hypothetical protein
VNKDKLELNEETSKEIQRAKEDTKKVTLLMKKNQENGMIFKILFENIF